MGSWFCDRPRLNFDWRCIYMKAERAVMLDEKVAYFEWENMAIWRKSFFSTSRDKFTF